MKRKAESDYRRQLEEERQRAIEESHWWWKDKKMRTGKALEQVEMRKVSMNFHFCRYFVLLIDLNPLKFST